MQPWSFGKACRKLKVKRLRWTKRLTSNILQNASLQRLGTLKLTSLEGFSFLYREQQYAAVKPKAALRVRFHELAHIVLEHGGAASPAMLYYQEIEAESVARLCCRKLQLDTWPSSSYLADYQIKLANLHATAKCSRKRVNAAAKKILLAGY